MHDAQTSKEPTTYAIQSRQLIRLFPGRNGTGVVRAVDNVSFDLATGGALGIVGESGSGKTTIARMVLGIETPTSGQVLVHELAHPKRATSSTRRQRARKVQMVFQDPYTSLNPRMTPLQALLEMRRVHFGEDRQRATSKAAELLEAVGLGNREARSRPRSLSGGQQQRVAIARALSAEPETIILDEAVSALDVSVQAQILNLLAELRTEFGLTYLLISHDLAVVDFLCNDVLVMRNGTVVERGPCSRILAAPADEYTKQLIESVPIYRAETSRGQRS